MAPFKLRLTQPLMEAKRLNARRSAGACAALALAPRGEGRKRTFLTFKTVK